MIEEKNANKIIKQLEKVSLVLNSAKGFYDILYKTCKAAVDLLKIDHSGFAIFEQNYSFLRVIAEYPSINFNKTLNSVIPIFDSQAETDLIQNKIINISNLQHDNKFGSEIKTRLLEYGIKSILIIPVCIQDKVVASFSLDSIKRKKIFTQNEIVFCKILSGFASIAMCLGKYIAEQSTEPKIIDNNIKLNIAINKNYGLCLIDKNLKIIWTNDFYKNRFGKDIVGKFCFEHIKKFKTPCHWCPHPSVIRNKNIATAISPTFQKEKTASLLQSQLLSFPYKFDKEGNVELILEILVEFSDKTFQQADKKRLSFLNHQKFTRLLRKANDNSIPYLIGFYLLIENYFDFDEVNIYFIDSVNHDGPTKVSKEVIYYKNRINQEIKKEFTILINDERLKNYNQIIGKVQASSFSNEHIRESSIEFHKYFNSQSINEPRRISSNEVCITIPLTNLINILIVVRVIDENSYLTESQFTAFAFFIPFINEIIQTKIHISHLNNAIDNLKNRLNEINIYKNILIHSAPYVVGKVHDLSFIHRKIVEEVDTLKNTSWNLLDAYNRNEQLSNSIEKIQNYAGNLQLIMKTMLDIVTLCKPKNELIMLSDIVYELKELFKEKLFVKHKQLTDEKIEKEPIELIIKSGKETKIYGDPVLYSHIFQNLIQNSISAFQLVQRKEKVISIEFIQTEKFTKIIFSDNASGINPDIIDNIWEMYYSTKVKGTGLGLFFVNNILKDAYNGSIEVQSSWGFGTTFNIIIPLQKS